MKRPSFVALGDLHLDPWIWRSYRDINGDAFLGFKSFVDVAIEWNVPVVLVGDIFDSVDPDPHIVRFFREQMDRCVEEDIAVYAIQGNHDKRATPWYAAIHAWPIHFGDGEQITIGGLSVVGFDYAVRDSIEGSLIELGDREQLPQVLFLHQAVDDALKFEGMWNCKLEWVPRGVPLIVMGDIHTEWQKEVRPGQWAYYTGPSHAREIGQRGPKSCMMVFDDLSVERIPIESREIQKFSVSAVDQLQRTDEWLQVVTTKEQPLKPLAWITYVSSTEVEVDELCRRYSDKASFILEGVADPEELDIDFGDELSDSTEDEVSVEKLLTQLVNPEKEPVAFGLVLALLDNGQGVFDTIREYREAFLTNNFAGETQ